MTKYFYINILCFLTACGSGPSASETGKPENAFGDTTNTMQPALSTSDSNIDTTDYENAIYYVVIADTDLLYSSLCTKMFDLNKKLSIAIDTMGRFYNKTKDLIALPDNDDDEMYAGDYFPRRFPSRNLSIEYLSLYQKQAGEKTMALVTGIYETEKSADSALVFLQKREKNAFKIQAEMYIGCLH